MFNRKTVALLVSVYATLAVLVYAVTPAEYALASNGIALPGAPLKGVDVKLGKNPGGKAARITKTDENGKFSFSDVPAGIYELTLTLPDNSAIPKSKALAISLTLNGVEGGTLKKDLDFKVEEVSSSKGSPAKPKFKNIVLTIRVVANGPVTGTVAERTTLQFTEKINTPQINTPINTPN